MKERPILFSGAMVRALLDGSKTQTRRIIKPSRHYPITFVGGKGDENDPSCWGYQCEDGFVVLRADGDPDNYQLPCPYGQPGDRLWVRESYRFTDVFDGDSPARVAERCLDVGYSKPWAPIHYDADGMRRDWRHTGTPPHDGEPKPGKGRPSIHMPRWASRILLEIVSVRVERLQDISQEDARAEGFVDGGCTNCGNSSHPTPCGCDSPSPDWADGFFGLWQSINGSESLIANPWVWVIEFKRV